jgi:benzoylformate decarboxylase
MATAGEILLDVLRSEGVRHIFGNPGSTELPLMDLLAAAEDIDYVLGLQEATVVGMADGYAQATGRPAFLSLHTSAGLGNALGNLTNAVAMGSPLVVTAGQQDLRHLATEPLLSGPLTEMARGTCKWVHEVRTGEELGAIIRRAFSECTNPPTGPVFVSIPMNLVDAEVSDGPPSRSRVIRSGIPSGLSELAELLAQCDVGRVAIVAGDEVATSGAVDALVAVAETLAAPVYGSPLHSKAVFPPAHPLWQGMLPPSAAALGRILARYDRVFLVGGKAFLVYPYSEGPAVPATTELLHLSPDPSHLGRVWPTRLGLPGDPAASLAALLPALAGLTDQVAVAAANATAAAARGEALARLETAATERYGESPMPAVAAAHALVRSVPPDTFLIDEAVTTGLHLRRFHQWTKEGRYFFGGGGGLGWGMPAACGVALAHPGSLVLCVVGDGAAMYSPQALWTAAARRLPVIFAVVNNGQYRILKDFLKGREGPSTRTGRFVGMEISDPPIDFVSLARSMGVPADRVSTAKEIGAAVQSARDAGGPHLLDVAIAP